MSRSTPKEIEFCDTFDRDHKIIENLPEIVKDLCGRLDVIEDTIRTIAECIDIGLKAELPERVKWVRVRLDGRYNCKVEHAGTINLTCDLDKNLNVIWNRQTIQTASQAIRYGSCNIAGAYVTFAHIKGKNNQYLTIHPGAVDVKSDQASKLNGELILRMRAKRVVEFLRSEGWRISGLEQKGNVVLGYIRTNSEEL